MTSAVAARAPQEECLIGEDGWMEDGCAHSKSWGSYGAVPFFFFGNT